MSIKVYSGLNELPNRRASDNVTKGCIVLEGGAFRGLYTSGVLDALMENDINMECTVGVSAGAMNGIGYAAGHIGYSARVNLGHRLDKRYVGPGAIKNNKGVIGFDIAFNAPDGLEPIALRRIPKLGKRFVAVATNCLTGKEEYFEADGSRKIFKAIKASASMPYISRPVGIGGKPYLDGGCACKIAYKWALEQGYEKIVVVRTREDSYRKPLDSSKDAIVKAFYHRYPNLVESLLSSNEDYNRQCDEINELAESGRIFKISPSEPVTVGRLEKDVEKLGALYHLGYDDAIDCLDALREYLNA